MPLDEKYSVSAESWEADDPIIAYKEVRDPYQDHSASLRELVYSKVRSRRPIPAQRFRRSDIEVANVFSELTEEWRESTAVESNLERIVLNSAYQRIIGLGPQVVPHILKDLDETQDHWFWALMAIVGEDKAAGQTSVGAAVEALLSWGRSAGIFDG